MRLFSCLPLVLIGIYLGPFVSRVKPQMHESAIVCFRGSLGGTIFRLVQKERRVTELQTRESERKMTTS